jgi:hypothetical protein
LGLLTGESESAAATSGRGCGCDGLCERDAPWIDGTVQTPTGPVARIGTRLTFSDRLGALRVRLGWNRMGYGVPPGLYAIGAPDASTHTLVSANYKLTFDALRQCLGGLDTWLLVLDTKKVNVWCAAGKGTFGTKELLHRIETTNLHAITENRTLILPQLGAPGVSAHRVKEASGFRVQYGPVRARDIPPYLEDGMRATPEMRRVDFPFAERMKVIPVELGNWLLHAGVLAAAIFALSLALGGPANWPRGAAGAGLVALAYFGGGILTPALLPWLPARAFSVKGAITGVALWAGSLAADWIPDGGLSAAALLFVMTSTSSFIGMNYTGTSTYTNPSGVAVEVRRAGPLQAVAIAAGVLLLCGQYLLTG